MPSLESLLKTAGKGYDLIIPAAAANAGLLAGMEGVSKRLNNMYSSNDLIPGITLMLSFTAAAAGSYLYLDQWAGKKIKDALQGKEAKSLGYALPVPLLFYAAYQTAPALTGAVEELIHNGLAIATLYSANKYVIFPGIKVLKNIFKVGKKRVAERVVFGATALGLIGFNTNVHNAGRDVHNFIIAAYHAVLAPNKRDLADYWMQYGLDYPVKEGVISSRFGYRRDLSHPEQTEFQDSIEIKVSSGTPVYAAEEGKVTAITRSKTGYTITLDHENGLQTSYRSASLVLKQQGVTVKRGEAIAQSGAHLEFSLEDVGKKDNPL